MRRSLLILWLVGLILSVMRCQGAVIAGEAQEMAQALKYHYTFGPIVTLIFRSDPGNICFIDDKYFAILPFGSRVEDHYKGVSTNRKEIAHSLKKGSHLIIMLICNPKIVGRFG